MRHIPVLLDEVAEVLAPQQGDVVVDGTFGAGGYTARLLATPVAHVHAIDRDPEAIAAGADLVAAHPGRLTLHQAPFSELAQIASEEVAAPIDAIVLDIGVSSMQLDQAERGFSFQKDGPLDMRMSLDGPSAADLVNTLDTATLARLLFVYGEEKKSRRIAAAIVARRAAKPFTRTSDLAALVAEVAPPLPRHRGGSDRHPATRTFQALRIAVNDELGELVQALVAAEQVLRPGGRLAVVTFHSLEDRIVKRFLRARSSSRPRGSRHMPEAAAPEASFQSVNSSGIKPGEREVKANPRARSATLRHAVRTSAAPHPVDLGTVGQTLGLPRLSL